MTDFTQKFYDRIAPVIDLRKARESLATIVESTCLQYLPELRITIIS
ncbi:MULTISPECIES: hypothetical protein [Entomomonas]|uniref:Uncharacterized protein n=1 Tax=Entomomonas asaccharolytica TaxID=2785331 RepID=A0A974RY32_9GAMM|nr:MULTISPECIES: hypothetical protein [Entomomonas]QQP86855.1 hypothetical protein JHT90_06330 [Entomomonas asaccharolytica]UYZ83527.1 hypothetical protein MTZ49_13125 [Entomomonas sp. E2T0]